MKRDDLQMILIKQQGKKIYNLSYPLELFNFCRNIVVCLLEHFWQRIRRFLETDKSNEPVLAKNCHTYSIHSTFRDNLLVEM